mmetsp:Transcript_43726/g.79813  ORF Transcript_43726/g.79813 Transcript_43726/m.79813 type:complete len:388 (-) Transcript_43726:32-1195(-)
MRCCLHLPPSLQAYQDNEGTSSTLLAGLYAELLAARSRCCKFALDVREKAEDVLLQLSPLVDESLSIAADCAEPVQMATVIFQPGALGLELERGSGVVATVHPGLQASAKGVSEGWILRSINDTAFTQGLLKRNASGREPYAATFEHCALPHQPLHEEDASSAERILRVRHENMQSFQREWSSVQLVLVAAAGGSVDLVQSWCDAWNNAKCAAPFHDEVSVYPRLLAELCELRSDQERLEVACGALRSRIAAAKAKLESACAAAEVVSIQAPDIVLALHSDTLREQTCRAVESSRAVVEQMEVDAREMKRRLDSSVCELDLRNVMHIIRMGESRSATRQMAVADVVATLRHEEDAAREADTRLDIGDVMTLLKASSPYKPRFLYNGQ